MKGKNSAQGTTLAHWLTDVWKLTKIDTRQCRGGVENLSVNIIKNSNSKLNTVPYFGEMGYRWVWLIGRYSSPVKRGYRTVLVYNNKE